MAWVGVSAVMLKGLEIAVQRITPREKVGADWLGWADGTPSLLDMTTTIESISSQ